MIRAGTAPSRTVTTALLGAVPACALIAVIAAPLVGLSGAWPAGRALGASLLITAVAVAVAATLGLTAALYLHTMAGDRETHRTKTGLALAAATPPVVAGWFAGAVLGPSLGLSASLLLAGGTLGVLLTPYYALRAEQVLASRPGNLYHNALALGVGPVSAAWYVLLPDAALDLIGLTLRTTARATGEAMVALLAGGATYALAVDALTDPAAALLLLLLVAALAYGARWLEARP